MRCVDRNSHQDHLAQAFNRGCDARLKGEGLKTCPYPHSSTFALRWREGWRDVNDNWKGRPLPPINDKTVIG